MDKDELKEYLVNNLRLNIYVNQYQKRIEFKLSIQEDDFYQDRTNICEEWITAKIPYDVGDAKVTGERWILGKRLFQRVLTLEYPARISLYQCTNSLSEKIQSIINQNYFDLGSGEEKHIKNQMICKKLIGKLPEIKQLKRK